MQALNLAVWDSPCSRHIRRKRSILHPALWLVTCKIKPLSMRRPEGRRVRHWSSSPGTCVITFSLWDRGELSTGAVSAPFKSRMSRPFERSVAPSSWPQTHIWLGLLPPSLEKLPLWHASPSTCLPAWGSKSEHCVVEILQARSLSLSWNCGTLERLLSVGDQLPLPGNEGLYRVLCHLND